MANAAHAEGRWEGRGRSAERPRDIPKKGWKDVGLRLKDEVKKDRLSIVAAGVAFYGLLAIFPAIAALVSLYGLMFDPQQVASQIEAFGNVLPPEAREIVLGQMQSVAQSSGTALGWGVAGGLLLAIWSASKGTKTLMEALNVAYDEREERGFFKLNGTALILTLGALVGAVIAIALIVALPAIVAALPLGSALEAVARWARWPVLAIAMVLGLAVIYRYGPDRDEPRWRWVSWGAVLGTALFLVGSALFSWYVTSFGKFNETYGSMGAVVILLMWFLLTAWAILIGAELNAEMERQTRRDTTKGREESMGRRGAHAADTVGEQR